MENFVYNKYSIKSEKFRGILCAIMLMALGGCYDGSCEVRSMSNSDIIDIAIKNELSREYDEYAIGGKKINNPNEFLDVFGNDCCSVSIENTSRYTTSMVYDNYYVVIMRHSDRESIARIDMCGRVF